MSDEMVYLERDKVIENVLSQMRASRSEECMRERLMNLEGEKVCRVVFCGVCSLYNGRQWDDNKSGICGRTDCGVNDNDFCSYGKVVKK